MIKIVPDTNLIISGLIFRGDARQIINLAYQKKIEFFGSDSSFRELRRVVNYDRFKKYLANEIFTPEKLIISYKSFINVVSLNAEYNDLKVVMDDPDDDEFIRIAKTVGSQIIVSNDKHLRKIKKFDNIRIIEPEIFIKLYPKLIGRTIT